MPYSLCIEWVNAPIGCKYKSRIEEIVREKTLDITDGDQDLLAELYNESKKMGPASAWGKQFHLACYNGTAGLMASERNAAVFRPTFIKYGVS